MTPLAVLRDALDRELAEYRELHSLSRQKGTQIVSGDLPNLRLTVEREAECLSRLEHAEAVRARASDDLAAEYALSPGTTLQEILPLLPPDARAELQERRYALLSVMDEVSRLNAANEALLQQSLAYVDFSLDLIHRAAAGADVYDANGRRPRAIKATWQRRA